jgi:hypothetical protein
VEGERNCELERYIEGKGRGDWFQYRIGTLRPRPAPAGAPPKRSGASLAVYQVLIGKNIKNMMSQIQNKIILYEE